MAEQVIEPFEVYQSKKDCVNASSLKLLNESCLHYKMLIEGELEKEETAALLAGSALHHYLYEKDIFQSKYIALKKEMLPVADKDGNKTYRSKGNRQFRDNFSTFHKGKTILEEEDYDMVLNCGESALKHPAVVALFKEGIAERSSYKLDERTGFMRKIRVDWQPGFGPALVDAKSCQNSAPYAFTRTVIEYLYDMAAAYYLDVLDKEQFVFIAIEKKKPYVTEVYNMSQEMIASGRSKYRMLLDILYWCKLRNTWPAYSGTQTLKNLYKDNFLESQDLPDVVKCLDNYFVQNELTKGIFTLNLPNWAKNL